LLGARVMVTNWHVLGVPDDARRRGIVQRGRPSAGAFANLVLRANLGSKGNLLVINDEAHHAWRAAARAPGSVAGLAGELATAGGRAGGEGGGPGRGPRR